MTNFDKVFDDLDKTLDDMSDNLDDIFDDISDNLDSMFGDQPRKKKKAKGKRKKSKEGQKASKRSYAAPKAKEKPEDGCPTEATIPCDYCCGRGTTGWRLPRYTWLIYVMVFLGIEDQSLSRGYFRRVCAICNGDRTIIVKRPPPPQGSDGTR